MDNNSKKYDVVILTFAPEGDLVDSVVRLMNQSLPPQKIVLYNTDESKLDFNIKGEKGFTLNECVNGRFANLFKIVHINEADFDHGKTRNDAMSLCESEYVLFMTDDAVPYDQYLSENLINAFEKYSDDSGRVAAAYARQIPKDSAKLKERIIREFNYPEVDEVKSKSTESTLGIKNYFFSNVCAMYDKSIFEKLGGFEENIILNEDTFYSYKAINNGYKIIYKSDARVSHSHNLSYIDQFNRNFDIGASQASHYEIFSKIPSEKEGIKLVKFFVAKAIKGLHFLTIFDFFIDCIYRYLGYKKGMNYKKLSKEDCIKYANNKNYFLKKETI